VAGGFAFDLFIQFSRADYWTSLSSSFLTRTRLPRVICVLALAGAQSSG